MEKEHHHQVEGINFRNLQIEGIDSFEIDFEVMKLM